MRASAVVLDDISYLPDLNLHFSHNSIRAMCLPKYDFRPRHHMADLDRPEQHARKSATGAYGRSFSRGTVGVFSVLNIDALQRGNARCSGP